jgi:hypothetical protein
MFNEVAMYHLLEDKMLVVDQIKIPASAVNGSQLLLLSKSDTTKTKESIGRGRAHLRVLRKEVLFKPREVMFMLRSIRVSSRRYWRRRSGRSGSKSNNAEKRATPAPV